MLLLNIADIHFNYPLCSTVMDPDRPYRTMLIQDARAKAATLGPVDAILLCGDIAYRGLREEYEAALEWLRTLCDATRCSLERVFVVPGNHDVDRSVIRGSASVRNVQSAIAAAQNKENELFQQFNDQETGRSLLAPVEAYNDFAKQFDCQLFSPEKLFWFQPIGIDDHTVLRLYGLTSTVLSGAGGNNDVRGNLYLSPLQTALDPVDGVVNLVMCHHPPDWLMDGDEVDDATKGRAKMHFFGHKHRARILRDPAFIRFSAGAVNPDRHEVGWEPGYNLVQLAITYENDNKYLNLEAHVRVWQTNPDMFRAKMTEQGDEIFRHRIQLPMMAAPTGAIAEARHDTNTEQTETGTPQTEAAMEEEKTRNLVLRFWNLASSERREIALELGLLENEEIRLPEAERYGRALVRAGARGLLDKIADEILRRELSHAK
jgi:predicted phosphodiesterase